MSPLDHIHPWDRWTHHADRALGILLLKDPVRTSLGLVFGSALSSLSVLFEPALRAVTFANFAAMSWWTWLPIGMLILHIPTIIQLVRKPSVGSHRLDVLFEVIERGNFSAAEKRQHYRRLIELFAEVAVSELDKTQAVRRAASASQ